MSTERYRMRWVLETTWSTKTPSQSALMLGSSWSAVRSVSTQSPQRPTMQTRSRAFRPLRSVSKLKLRPRIRGVMVARLSRPSTMATRWRSLNKLTKKLSAISWCHLMKKVMKNASRSKLIASSVRGLKSTARAFPVVSAMAQASSTSRATEVLLNLCGRRSKSTARSSLKPSTATILRRIWCTERTKFILTILVMSVVAIQLREFATSALCAKTLTFVKSVKLKASTLSMFCLRSEKLIKASTSSCASTKKYMVTHNHRARANSQVQIRNKSRLIRSWVLAWARKTIRKESSATRAVSLKSQLAISTKLNLVKSSKRLGPTVILVIQLGPKMLCSSRPVVMTWVLKQYLLLKSLKQIRNTPGKWFSRHLSALESTHHTSECRLATTSDLATRSGATSRFLKTMMCRKSSRKRNLSKFLSLSSNSTSLLKIQSWTRVSTFPCLNQLKKWKSSSLSKCQSSQFLKLLSSPRTDRHPSNLIWTRS